MAMRETAVGGGSGSNLKTPTPDNSCGPLHLRQSAVGEVDEAALDAYKEHGYIIGPQVLDDADVLKLRKEFKRLFSGERDFSTSPYEFARWRDTVEKSVMDKDPGLRKLNNSWWLNAAIRSVVVSPVLGAIAAKLMGTTEVRLWHDQAIWKPATSHGDENLAGNVGWHQDYAHWRISNTTNMCTAFIALQDTDLSNGGLRTIEGSHKWGLLRANTFFEKDLDRISANIKEQAEELAHQNKRAKIEWKDKPTILKAGQVAFHHSLTVHGSGPNLGEQPRLAIAVHMQPADCAYQPGETWHQNLHSLGPHAKAGDLFVGHEFPRLWPATFHDQEATQ